MVFLLNYGKNMIKKVKKLKLNFLFLKLIINGNLFFKGGWVIFL